MVLTTVGFATTASAQLSLSSPEFLQIPGFVFGSSTEEARVTGSAIDPVTGHLWVSGRSVQLDEESVLFADPGLAEIDLTTRQVVSTIGRSYELDHAVSLAIHPTTCNLWVSWLDTREDHPNLSGALEIQQNGQVQRFVSISQTGDFVGHVGDWDPALFGPAPGLELYLSAAAFSPSGEMYWMQGGGLAYRFNSDTLHVDEQFTITGGPNTNYSSGVFDPITGHWFVATTSNTLLEIDPTSHVVLSETDLKSFVPPPTPSFNPNLVQAVEFDLTGTQLILGGDFGLITVARAVPEPESSTCALCVVAALGLAAVRIRRRLRCR